MTPNVTNTQQIEIDLGRVYDTPAKIFSETIEKIGKILLGALIWLVSIPFDSEKLSDFYSRITAVREEAEPISSQPISSQIIPKPDEQPEPNEPHSGNPFAPSAPRIPEMPNIDDANPFAVVRDKAPDEEKEPEESGRVARLQNYVGKQAEQLKEQAAAHLKVAPETKAKLTAKCQNFAANVREKTANAKKLRQETKAAVKQGIVERTAALKGRAAALKNKLVETKGFLTPQERV